MRHTNDFQPTMKTMPMPPVDTLDGIERAFDQEIEACFHTVSARLDAEYGGMANHVESTWTCEIGDTTMVVMPDYESGLLHFFADVGLPVNERSAYRAALERNLVIGVLPVTLGVNAHSGKLVASAALQIGLDADPGPATRAIVDQLLACVHDMHARFEFTRP